MATAGLCGHCRRLLRPRGSAQSLNTRHWVTLWRTLSFIPDTISAITSKSKDYGEEKILGYSQEQLFNVIADVENYQVFLPWCHESKYLRKGDTNSIAKLSIGFPPLLETYTALVWTKPPHQLKNISTDGRLFSHLENSWSLKPGPSCETGPTCIVNFWVRFEFRTLVYARLGSLFFDEVARTMASSFEARCAELYGPDHLKTSKRVCRSVDLLRNRQRSKVVHGHRDRLPREDL